MKLVHSKKAREADTREKVRSGNTDAFCRGVQALLRRVYVGATAYKISGSSGIDTFLDEATSDPPSQAQRKVTWGKYVSHQE
jgi:hypothetical protein